MRKAKGTLSQQYLMIMLGTFVTFALLIVFNFILRQHQKLPVHSFGACLYSIYCRNRLRDIPVQAL